MRTSIVVLFIFIVSCQGNQETIHPTLQTITESVYASGVIKSSHQYNVYSNVSGIIKEVSVQENDTVNVGSPLFNIANDVQIFTVKNAELNVDYNAVSSNQGKLQEVQANIHLAKERVSNDSMMLNRQQNLWAQSIGTRVDLENRVMALANSRTALHSAEQKYIDLKKALEFSAEQAHNNLKSIKTNTGDYVVKSTIKGRVYQINKQKGEMVSTQVPLAIIGDSKNYILEMQVDEYDIVSIKLGMRVSVVLNSYKDSVFSAVVTKINPIMNAQSKTFTIEAAFTKAPEVLYPFISFEANILIHSKQNALLIPRNYLYNDSMVYLKSGERKIVRTGLKDFQMIEITSGIDQNDELILPK